MASINQHFPGLSRRPRWSQFPTLRGWLVLAVALLGVIGGILWGQRAFVLIGSILLASWLAEAVALLISAPSWATPLRSGCIIFQPDPVWTGTELRARWQGSGNAALSAPLPDGLSHVEEPSTDPAGADPLILAEHRGSYRVDARASRCGLFGCWRQHLLLPDRGALTVWPPAVWLDTGQPAAEAEHGPHRFSFNREFDVAVREYQPGDSLRRVHWRATARRGQLMARAETPGQPRQLAVELRTSGPSPAAERAISVAASLCVSADWSGIMVRLYAGGQSATGRISSLLNLLAGLDPAAQHDPAPVSGPRILIADSTQPTPNASLTKTSVEPVETNSAQPAADDSAFRVLITSDPDTAPEDGCVLDVHESLAQNAQLLGAALASAPLAGGPR